MPYDPSCSRRRLQLQTADYRGELKISEMQVKDVMTTEVVTVDPEMDVTITIPDKAEQPL